MKNLKSYLPVSYGIIGVLLLLIILTWNEPLSLRQTINPEKFTAFTSVIAVALTLLSVYLLHRQNFQQAEAFKAAYKPDLFPENFRLYVKKTDSKILNMDIGEYEYVLFKDYYDDCNCECESECAFLIHNIGLGLAKNVRFHWIYDTEATKKILDRFHIMGGPANHKQSHNFLRPNEKTKVFVAGDVLNLQDNPVLQQVIIYEGTETPKAKLEVQFDDVHNNHYIKIFNVKISAAGGTISIRFDTIEND